MLLIYTFVFSVVFKARWGTQEGSRIEFAVILFIGLMIYNVVSEVLVRSPSLIISNTNFVKKIIFPLEILPIVSLCTSLFHMAISFIVWIISYIILFGLPHYTALYLPLIMIPVVFFTLGLSWFLSSLGVYIRDVGQIIGLFTTILLFISPIFYPANILPPEYQVILNMNPLTFIIEQARAVLMWGETPDFRNLMLMTTLSMIVAAFGLAWFQKTRGGFADVL